MVRVRRPRYPKGAECLKGKQPLNGSAEGLLDLAQQRLRLLPLLRYPVSGGRAFWSDRLKKGLIGESVFARCLVALTGALIDALLEKCIAERSRLLSHRDRTLPMPLESGVGNCQGRGTQKHHERDDAHTLGRKEDQMANHAQQESAWVQSMR
jgi:hypothetical protein